MLGRWSKPAQVLSNTSLAVEAKRALLASWASDANAIPNMPALRRLEDGTVLDIDEILEAMRRLDDPLGDDEPPTPVAARVPPAATFDLSGERRAAA
jgi:hypothetical protein